MDQSNGPLRPSATSGMKTLRCSSPLPLPLVGYPAAYCPILMALWSLQQPREARLGSPICAQFGLFLTS